MPKRPNLDEEATKCQDFLQMYEGQSGDYPYRIQLQEVANRERKVVKVLLDDIIDHKNDTEFVSNIQRNTVRYIRLFEAAIDTLLPQPTEEFERDVYDILNGQHSAQQQQQQQQPGSDENLDPQAVETMPAEFVRRFEVSIVPESLSKVKKLREVRAVDVGHLVKVTGMVTRCTEVKPQMKVCVFTCDYCGSEMFMSVKGDKFMPLQECASLQCKENKTSGKVHMQSRGSKFSKFQEVRIQELPDQVPVGHIPRCMTIRCTGENTRQCGPGDMVTMSGIFLADRKVSWGAARRGNMLTYIFATDVQKEKLGYDEVQETLSLRRQVEEVALSVSPYDTLAKSIAPEIFGHEDVKKALLLQLVGGVTRSLTDGMKIRGDINICLMGDPGVAKSQLLKYIATVAPRGVYTTGKGSSGVGLTAAVVKDSVSGELALEGGALVMADRGICCIDEFDKMDDNDRTAIHEVMEQQTISIAKAGITTTLNARAAVLAAANPLYGRYNKKRSVSDNIDLPNSLLSRFDLLFLILDKADMEMDRALSLHILHVHKYLKNPDPVFEPLAPNVVKQYIAASRKLQPTVPRELTTYIVEQYVNLRAQDSMGQHGRGGKNDQTAMTPRQLLSILRLSQALARIRWADAISEEDVNEAIRLTDSSKSSLEDDTPSGPQDDPVSAIFRILNDYVQQHHMRTIQYAQAEAMVLSRGFKSEQLSNTLAEYENLQVLHVTSEGDAIIFD